MNKHMSPDGKIVNRHGVPVTYWNKKSAIYDAWKYGSKFKAECILVRLPMKLLNHHVQYCHNVHCYVFSTGMFKRYGVILTKRRLEDEDV